MSLRISPRLAFVLAILTLLPAGCGEEVKVKEVPASAVPPPRTTDREKGEIQPRKGSSAGMNYNPGGPPPGANVD